MDFRAPDRRSPDLARVYPLAGVAMLAAVLLVLLDLLYVALRSVGGPSRACSASSALRAEGAPPVEDAVGHRLWWPPSVVCEQMTGSPALYSLTPGSQIAFWAAVCVFTAGFLAVAGTCLGPVLGMRGPVDDAGRR
ncbi:MAG TPA: hypothetical protein VLK55_00325 [Kocuria rosea]|nr:hypothetical protein [Kocuria rosea]